MRGVFTATSHVTDLHGWKSLSLLVLVLSVVSAPSVAGQTVDGNRRVLILYSTSHDAELAALGERELPQILNQGLGRSLDYYSEYIDLARFPDPIYQSGLRHFLQLKYGGQRFDIVIALEDASVEFVDRYRAELFPDTPVVFLAVQPGRGRVPNSTGLQVDLDFVRTVTLAVTLQPDVRQVFVVSGMASRDTFYLNLARQSFQGREAPITFTYLSGLTMKDLERRVSTLPEHSIIFYLLVSQDGAGVNVRPQDYLNHLASLANAPIYSWNDTTVDRGVVGGSFLNVARAVDVVAGRAVRVLRGEPADSIPTTAPSDVYANQLDWRQLRRWGISEKRVPAGSQIRFRADTVWDRYWAHIVGASATIVIQMALIAALLTQARQRRSTELLLRQSETDLRARNEQVPHLVRRLMTAQEAERARIARELHDDVSQQVALLAIDLELLARGDRGHGLMDQAVSLVHDLARSMRDLSHRLHPAKLRLTGLVSALRTLQRELSRPEMAIGFTSDAVPAALPDDLSLCLFRIVQEALQNAIKHSAAREVSVQLRGDGERLVLTIVDDGRGFDVDAAWGKGLGLINITERLDAFHGTLQIFSKGGAGTRLEVVVPLPHTQLNEDVDVLPTGGFV